MGLDIYSFLLLQKKPKTKTKPHMYMTETIVADPEKDAINKAKILKNVGKI